MNLKKTKKEWLFIKSIKLAKANYQKTGVTILFDLMFLVSFFVMQKLFSFFAQSLNLPATFSSFYILLILSLIYYLIVLFAYSFFKYSILNFIKSLFENTSFSFRRLGQFYYLNIIIAGIFVATALLLNYVLISIKQTYAPYVLIFFAIPFGLFVYVVVNMSHSLFCKDRPLKDTIKNGFKFTLTKMKNYRETILVVILFVLIVLVLIQGINYIFNFIVGNNYGSYLITYSYFRQFSIIILDTALYFIILINRISFYSIAKEIK